MTELCTQDSAEIANVATYSDYFPDLPVANNDNEKGGWISIGYSNPPPAPEGFVTEVKRDTHLGIVTDYRCVRPIVAAQQDGGKPKPPADWHAVKGDKHWP